MGPFTTALAVLLASASTASGTIFSLKESYDATNFFSKFDFFESKFGTNDPNGQDPNQGFVNYLNSGDAFASDLVKYQGNDVYIGVDYQNKNLSLDGRPSIRLESKKDYTKGLFIARFSHLPKAACGAWPAFWTYSKVGSWPNGGEVDMYENWNLASQNHPTFHTGDVGPVGRCVINTAGSTGSLLRPDCAHDRDNIGCNVDDTKGPWASPDGGIYAMEWTDSHIRIFTWSHADAPSNIVSKHPDTVAWGKPVIEVRDGPCNLKRQFAPQKLVLNIDFCGVAAGNPKVWDGECGIVTGEKDCNRYVRNNPEQYKDVYWKVQDIRYFEEGYKPDPTSSSTTTTSSSSTSSSTTTSTTSSTTSITTSSSRTTSSLHTSSLSSASSVLTSSSSATSSTGGSSSSSAAGSTSSSSAVTTSRPISTSSATTASSVPPVSSSALSSSLTSSSSSSTSATTSLSSSLTSSAQVPTSSATTESTLSSSVTSSDPTSSSSSAISSSSSSSAPTSSSIESSPSSSTPIPTGTSFSSTQPTDTSAASSSGFISTSSVVPATTTSSTSALVPTRSPSSISTPAVTTSLQEWTTSIVYTTTTYTITSCAPTVTNCPGKGHVVTETIPLYTTVCPVTPTATTSLSPSTSAPGQPETITTKVTKVYTITSCAPTVINCPVGKVTTEIFTSTLCPGCNKNTNKPSTSSLDMGCRGDNCASGMAVMFEQSASTIASSSVATVSSSIRPLSTGAVSVIASTSSHVASTGIVPSSTHQPTGTQTQVPTTGLASPSKSVSKVVALVAGMLVAALFL